MQGEGHRCRAKGRGQSRDCCGREENRGKEVRPDNWRETMSRALVCAPVNAHRPT